MQAKIMMKPVRAFVDMSVRMARTRANYWAEFVMDGLIAILLLVAGFSSANVNLLVAVGVFAGGLFVFSFIEYYFHRWLFHTDDFDSLMAQGHDAHHKDPMGYDALPFFLPAFVFLLVMVVFSVFMPISYALVLTGGVAVGYFIYGMGHYIIHHVKFRHPLAKRWAAYHFVHHGHPDKNFGVSTPLWDIILGTRYKA